MQKTELELKKDQIINSSLALSRLQLLHKTMSDSLKYINKIVSFMVFDQDTNNQKEYSSLDDSASIANIKRDVSQEIDMEKMSMQDDAGSVHTRKSYDFNTVENFQ